MTLSLRTLAFLFASVYFVFPLAAADPKAEAQALDDQAVRLIQSGTPKDAIPYLDKAIQLEPNEAYHYLHRGIAYCDLRKWELSLADYDRALTLNPRYPQAMMNRGNLCQRVGRYRQSIEHYDRALAMSPPPWLEKMIRTAKANNEQNQQDVLKGILKAPDDDIPQLAREFGTHRDPVAFWKRLGKVEVLSMSRMSPEGNGYRRESNSLRCVRIEMPVGRGKWGTMPVYIQLQRGDILHSWVQLQGNAGVAILNCEDPIGFRTYHVGLWLNWIYHKSGI